MLNSHRYDFFGLSRVGVAGVNLFIELPTTTDGFRLKILKIVDKFIEFIYCDCALKLS